MGRTLTKYNVFQFYIKEEFKPFWIEFLRLSKKDPNFSKRGTDDVGHKGVTSKAISSLIYNYVMDCRGDETEEETEQINEEIKDEKTD